MKKKLAATPKQHKISVPSSGKAIAAALLKNFPKDSQRIISVLLGAATNKSMQRKLTRVQLALGKGGAA